MRKLAKFLAAFLVAFLASGFSVSAASAAEASWTTPSTQLETQSPHGNMVTLPNGTVLLHWVEVIDSKSVLRIKTKSLGSANWSTPESVTPENVNTSISSATFSGDAAGNLIAVWYDTTGDYKMKASDKRAGQSWTTPAVIGDGFDGGAGDPQLVTDSTGSTTAFWPAYIGQWTLQTAELPAGGTWSPTQTINNECADLRGVVGKNGVVTLAYKSNDGVDRIKVLSKQFGQGWGAPAFISPSNFNATAPQVAISPDNEVTVAWQKDVNSEYSQVQAATRSAEGTWSEAVDVSLNNYVAQWHSISSDTEGNVTLIWTSNDRNGGPWIRVTATKPHGGAWTSPVEFSANSNELQLSTLTNGSTLAVWTVSGASNEIKYSIKPLNGSWTSAQTIYTSEEMMAGLKLGSRPNGTAIAMWWQWVGGGPHDPQPVYKMQTAELNYSFQVTYNVNGGLGTQPETQTFTTNTTTLARTLPADLKKAGYEFLGWNTKADGTGQAVVAGTAFTPTEDSTLFAQWTPAESLAATGGNLLLLSALAALFLMLGSMMLASSKLELRAITRHHF
ncbi:MAG: hypothetical protein RLZZ56_1230 [Actinomycetota bacterium]